MIWGETGTRHGATRLQVASVGWLWSRYPFEGLHDGDSVGVDEQLYHLALIMGLPEDEIVMHPPTNSKFRAWCGYDGDGMHTVTMRGTKQYHARDRDVVDESEVMVGCPQQFFEPDSRPAGGTWYTIDYARMRKRPLAIVWPNGLITYENWNLERL